MNETAGQSLAQRPLIASNGWPQHTGRWVGQGAGGDSGGLSVEGLSSDLSSNPTAAIQGAADDAAFLFMFVLDIVVMFFLCVFECKFMFKNQIFITSGVFLLVFWV